MINPIRNAFYHNVSQQLKRFTPASSKAGIAFNPWITTATIGVSTAAGYLYFSNSSKISLESNSALKGDGEWVDFKLSNIETLSHNVKRFTFDLPKDNVLGLTYTSCLLAKFVTEKGSPVIRPYTPVSDLETPGEFKLVIKRYENGKFGNHIFGLSKGDTVSFKGPISKYPWTPNKHDQIGLIGAGTGITPLYQLIHGITSNPDDKTKITLYYGNISEDDILLRNELEELEKRFPSQFKVHFFINEAKNPETWNGYIGFITKEFIEKTLFQPGQNNVKVFVCGPDPLYKAISGPKASPTDQGELTGALKDIGFTKEQVFKY
jgi:cytochrome-b5 reductase